MLSYYKDFVFFLQKLTSFYQNCHYILIIENSVLRTVGYNEDINFGGNNLVFMIFQFLQNKVGVFFIANYQRKVEGHLGQDVQRSLDANMRQAVPVHGQKRLGKPRVNRIGAPNQRGRQGNRLTPVLLGQRGGQLSPQFLDEGRVVDGRRVRGEEALEGRAEKLGQPRLAAQAAVDVVLDNGPV